MNRICLNVVATVVLPVIAWAAAPVVKTVPWVPAQPLLPHDTWSGKTVRLKGTANVLGPAVNYRWSFGDGSADATGIVTDNYAIEASHAYAGAAGQIFTATLTVTDTSSPQPNSASAQYFIKVENQALPVEVNVALDEGLWYIHKLMNRFDCAGAVACGNWENTYYAKGRNGTFINAFEVNGHLETGTAGNPYTETVSRGMKYLFTQLASTPVSMQTQNGTGGVTFNPDSNGNGLGIYLNQGNELYQSGMIIDAIVASGTPNALATTGPANIINRSYKSIVQDMMDYHSYCQYDSDPGGGWRYGCNNFPDNSVNQWAAIGLLAGERQFGIAVPPAVKNFNKIWVGNSQRADGAFGYTGPNPVWGPFATTPSGMVQLALDKIGRGDPMWDKAETFMRDNFGPPTSNAVSSPKNYFYGLFSFTKSMLLHDNGSGTLGLKDLRSQTPGILPIKDWYAAEKSKGEPEDGVARTLVNAQAANGDWPGNDYSGDQIPFNVGWAVIMLNRTVFTSGEPVACATATPNPVFNGGTVQLRGTCSFHQDPNKQIVQWDWDPTGGTNFTLHGVNVSKTFSGPVGSTIPVRLRVTDNAGGTNDTIINIVINAPPLSPTANPGGPYNICPQNVYLPFYLNGTKSTNPDEGKKDPNCPNCPGDTIVSYEWDFFGNNQFVNAGPQPLALGLNNTGPYAGKQGQSFNLQLRVTDRNNLAFPGSQAGVDVKSTQVFVLNANDPFCSKCVATAQALPTFGTPARPAQVQLLWIGTGADHYNIYRATANGGPYALIAGNRKLAPGQTQGVYIDTNVVNGNTYYYRVAPATLNDTETCQSNQTFTATIRNR